MGIKCFLIEPSNFWYVGVTGAWGVCPKIINSGAHYGNAKFKVGGKPSGIELSQYIGREYEFCCRNCGEKGSALVGGASTDTILRRIDTGEEGFHVSDFGPGAMWFAHWYENDQTGKNGERMYGWDWDNQFEPPLIVKCPNGRDWVIDSRASNCTMPGDRLHRCWVRHGAPPNITVDKNGTTCAAGAGSIQAGDYHGFLRNGEFT